MERATRLLDRASAVVIVLAGAYMQYAFSDVLSVVARVVIGGVVSVYALACLSGWVSGAPEEFGGAAR